MYSYYEALFLLLKTRIKDKLFIVIIIGINWIVGNILLSTIRVKTGDSGMWLPVIMRVTT